MLNKKCFPIPTNIQIIPKPPRQKKRFESNDFYVLFSIVNAYLWFHGVGFTEKLRCRKNLILKFVISVSFALIFEGNFIWILYTFFRIIYKNGFSNSRREVADTLFFVATFVMRLFFYFHRKELKYIMRALLRVHDKVRKGKIRVKNIGMVLILAFIGQDLHCVYSAYSATYEYFGAVGGKYTEKKIPVTFYFITYALYTQSVLLAAVTAYFYSCCLVLVDTLRAYKKRLVEESTGDLIKTYAQLIHATSRLCDFMNLPLLLSFISLLSAAFSACYAVTFEKDLKIFPRVFTTLTLFVHIVLVCRSSSSVLDITVEIRAIAERKSRAIPDHETQMFFRELHGSFPAFKILDSIVIDSSLIFTALGNLITYGILVATFNSD